MATEKASAIKQQFIETTSASINKICDKWCQEIKNIVKESHISPNHMKRFEEKFVKKTTAKWSKSVDDTWSQHNLNDKLAELHRLKLLANDQSAEKWRRYGQTPEQQTQSTRTACLLSLVDRMEQIIKDQQQVLGELICQVQHKRDTNEKYSKRRQKVSQQMDVNLEMIVPQ